MKMGNYSLKVERHVEKLKNTSYSIIERQVTRKRLDWFEGGQLDFSSSPSPKEAYELFFIDYMGLSREDVPVISETPSKITWQSFNKCPTLDACRRLDLDTRQVCRAIYEKSTQAFISQLDPRLRFHRDYAKIRPHSDYCQEMIVRIDFEGMMKVALEEARISRQEGNKGYGAVIAFEGRLIARAHDTAATENDPSLHAEVNAIRQAVKRLGAGNLCGAVLFSTCEPCPMCSSLTVWSNLTTVVYGISIEETARLGRTRIGVSCHEIINKSPVLIEVIPDVLHEECRDLYV